MAKIAVMIDRYKRKKYEAALTKEKFNFTKNPGLTPDTLNLTVVTTRVESLHLLCTRLEEEFAKKKLH